MRAVQISIGRPFRGSSALASGALTRGVLYGPGYRRLYPDIHIAASAVLDFETWSRAAYELVAPCGVLAGYSAAELHGASCAPAGARAEILLLGGYRRRACPMLLVHLDAVAHNEITVIEGMRLTAPDLAGREFALDLAYPELKLAIEYNGADHQQPDRALRDLEREQLLAAAGWRIIRFGAVTALHHPRTIAARVRQELQARGVPA